MHVAVVQLGFSIPHARSLKDKRQAIRSFRDRLAGGFNVSVAETGAQDKWQRAVFAAAMVGGDRRYVEGAMRKIVDFAGTFGDLVLVDSRIDFL